MKRRLAIFCILIVLVAAILMACGGTDTVSSEVDPDIYYGRYTADEVGVSDTPKQDSVKLIVRGTRYTVEPFPTADDPTVDFCLSSGIILGLGTNEITFAPSDTIGVNCDGIRIPQGRMAASYPGDSIIVSDTVEISFVVERDRGRLETVTSDWGLTLELTR